MHPLSFTDSQLAEVLRLAVLIENERLAISISKWSPRPCVGEVSTIGRSALPAMRPLRPWRRVR